MGLRLFRAGKTQFSLNLLSLPVAAAAMLFGRAEDMLITIFSLFLHELAHTATAYAAGRSVDEIELTPFGFIARLGPSLSGERENIMIAAAGPLFSLSAGMACFSLHEAGLVQTERVLGFAAINAALGFVNLLPALPLDGGRIVEGALSMVVKRSAAATATAITGMAIASLLIAYSAIMLLMGKFEYFYAVLGALLFPCAARELKRARSSRAERMAEGLRSLRAGNHLAVRTVAVSECMRAGEALRLIASPGYTRLVVLDGGMREMATLGEAELMEGIARLGPEAAIGTLLSAHMSI